MLIVVVFTDIVGVILNVAVALFASESVAVMVWLPKAPCGTLIVTEKEPLVLVVVVDVKVLPI